MSRLCDGVAVRRISTLLEAAGRVEGNPVRLVENSGVAFIGCYVLGMGFIISPQQAQEWIAADPRNVTASAVAGEKTSATSRVGMLVLRTASGTCHTYATHMPHTANRWIRRGGILWCLRLSWPRSPKSWCQCPCHGQGPWPGASFLGQQKLP